ncbi:unnamed protein product [Owenia fusiformis]|uniref:Uncharacterized protein n=1 Tax=Owenia fusiformis TaxID=6347 RepID=A0A8J1UBG1_OWEFU|nr:unnamed protein product [Owenia fusiformis]
MYTCAPNDIETDWDHGWQKENDGNDTTKAFALPHSSTPKCGASFFIKKTWNTPLNVPDICDNIFNSRKVKDVAECLRVACLMEANVVDYFRNTGRCRLLRCNWLIKPWKSNSYFKRVFTPSNEMDTFTLASNGRWKTTLNNQQQPTTKNNKKTDFKTTETIMTENIITESTKQVTATTKSSQHDKETSNQTLPSSTEQMEFIRKQNFDFRTLSMIMIGISTALFIALSALIVVFLYIIRQRNARMRNKAPRYNQQHENANGRNAAEEADFFRPNGRNPVENDDIHHEAIPLRRIQNVYDETQI